jgi:fructose-1,6-bisphosphatase
MNSKQFEVGDTVKWTSQAGGNTRTKEGRIVEIVPPNVRPNVPKIAGSRQEISYVVEVARPKSVARYWPRVASLKLVSKPS